MKKSFLIKVAASLVIAAAATQSMKADPAEAEDTAYRMARKFVEKGFAMAPTDHSGVAGSGSAIEFLIPVNKGLDYVFLVGTDKAAREVDLYVYDDVGQLILAGENKKPADYAKQWDDYVSSLK